MNELRAHSVNDSEVDLFQVMATIWEKKKQILSYTVLIVVGAVLFSYFQPKYYETKMVALVLPSQGDAFSSKHSLPLEYYEQFSKSPEILKAVLERLPSEVKFEDNIPPLDYLMSILRVNLKVINATPDLASSAIKLTYFVRHTDPISAYKIANTWREVLDENFAEFAKGIILSKYLDKFELSKAKWEEANKRIVDFKEKNSIKTKPLEMHAVQQLIQSAYRDIQLLEQQMDATKINISISKIEEQYSSIKYKVSEYKKQLKLQSPLLAFTGKRKRDQGINSEDFEYPRIISPIYVGLIDKLLTYEIQLKELLLKKSLLEKQKSKSLKSNDKAQSQIEDSLGFKQKRDQIKNRENKIKQYESRYAGLESQISRQKLDFKTLTQEEVTLATLFKSDFKKFKALQSLYTTQYSRGLGFNKSGLEPVIFMGTPMQRIVFIAFGSGLIFMILITLIKSNFDNREDEYFVRQKVAQNVDTIRNDIVPIEQSVENEKMTEPQSNGSDSLKESSPQESKPTLAYKMAGFK